MPLSLSFLRFAALIAILLHVAVAVKVFEKTPGGLPAGWTLKKIPKPSKIQSLV